MTAATAGFRPLTRTRIRPGAHLPSTPPADPHRKPPPPPPLPDDMPPPLPEGDPPTDAPPERAA